MGCVCVQESFTAGEGRDGEMVLRSSWQSTDNELPYLPQCYASPVVPGTNVLPICWIAVLAYT